MGILSISEHRTNYIFFTQFPLLEPGKGHVFNHFITQQKPTSKDHQPQKNWFPFTSHERRRSIPNVRDTRTTRMFCRVLTTMGSLQYYHIASFSFLHFIRCKLIPVKTFLLLMLMTCDKLHCIHQPESILSESHCVELWNNADAIVDWPLTSTFPAATIICINSPPLSSRADHGGKCKMQRL